MDVSLEGSRDGFAGRMEILGDRSGRRSWSESERARIAAESLVPGVRVADIARRHEVTRWQVYDWRKKLKAGVLALPAETAKVRWSGRWSCRRRWGSIRSAGPLSCFVPSAPTESRSWSGIKPESFWFTSVSKDREREALGQFVWPAVQDGVMTMSGPHERSSDDPAWRADLRRDAPAGGDVSCPALGAVRRARLAPHQSSRPSALGLKPSYRASRSPPNWPKTSDTPWRCSAATPKAASMSSYQGTPRSRQAKTARLAEGREKTSAKPKIAITASVANAIA